MKHNKIPLQITEMYSTGARLVGDLPSPLKTNPDEFNFVFSRGSKSDFCCMHGQYMSRSASWVRGGRLNTASRLAHAHSKMCSSSFWKKSIIARSYLGMEKSKESLALSLKELAPKGIRIGQSSVVT